jgi:hypothetical protein
MTATDRDVPLPEEPAVNPTASAPVPPRSREEQLDASLDVLEERVGDARRFLAAWRLPEL